MLLDDIAQLQPGETVADAEFAGITGATFRLSELVAGSCLVVVFFDYRCPYCRELAEDGRLTGSVAGVDVVWVSLPADRDETQAFVEEFDLGPAWYMIETWPDVAALGLVATPTVRTFAPGPTFVADVHPRTLEMEPSCLTGR